MPKPDRTCFNEFVRLDQNDPDLSNVDDIEVYSYAATAEGGDARDVMLDPRTALIDGIDGVDETTRITYSWANAEVRIPHHGGPHHLVAVWVFMRSINTVYGTFYRLPPDEHDQEGVTS